MHAKARRSAPKPISQPKIVPAQPECKGGMCKRAMTPQRRIMQPQSYAQALDIIRTQMSANDVFVHNLFNKSFIDMVLSLNLSDAQTQALLEAGVNLHAPLTDNDQTTQQTLSFLRNNIEGFVQNRPQPIVQPIAPQQPAPVQPAPPIVSKPPVIAPKKAAPAQPVAPVQPPIIAPNPVAPVQSPVNVNAPQTLLKIGNTKITFVLGDITHQKVDAIVNAANENLRHRGGIAAAISQAAGPSLQKYSNTMPAINAQGEKCPTGGAVITPAFNLEKVGIKKIIHAVGPLGTDPNKKQLLTNAYQNSLKVAKNNGLRSVALPAISTAIFGYNINEATPVAFAAVRDFIKMNPKAFDEIRFVLFSNKDLDVYEKFKNELLK
jgi:O-acetyl-ADP-ribose deacetylase (regulator of RNase III)